MNIFNSILSYLNSKKSSHGDVAVKSLTENNNICFSLSKDSDEVKIKLLFEENSLESSQNMGRFLYELNNGFFSESIMDLMLELAGENEDYKQFIDASIIFWLKCVSENQTNNPINIQKNIPIIKPSNFMNSTNHVR
jgi:hypothetical protein